MARFGEIPKPTVQSGWKKEFRNLIIYDTIAGMSKTPKEPGFFYFLNMFTGIIADTGKVARKTDAALSISAKKSFLNRLKVGVSVSVDGVCLTVASRGAGRFNTAVMPETFLKTNFGRLKKGSAVNLELPATPSSFLSGHIVQGHSDGTAKLLRIVKDGNSHTLTLSAPASLLKYVVEKGSVTLNGISLTVIGKSKKNFTVGIVPHTWDATTMRNIAPGDFLNLEVDVLAKYAETFSKKRRT